MYRVNLTTKTFYIIKNLEDSRQYLIPDCNRFDINIRSIMDGLADEAYCKAALDFVDISTLPQRMRDTNHITMDILGRRSGWCKLRFIKEDTVQDGDAQYVIFVIEAMDEDKNYSVLEALSRNFENVYFVNLHRGTARILKLEDRFVNGRLDKNNHRPFPYEGLMNVWIEEDVHPTTVRRSAGR